ncbi:MAG: monovalent cation/H+ antiporter complex subunit F [Verrucomicrobiales bacterium]|nr:monovalent cation/H+ antiporter complex subunit F [Verrucomicrobiales bacterium]
MMETFFICAGIALLLMMAPVFYRIIVGPTAIDRIVAVNVIGTKTAVLLIIIGVIFDNVAMFVDFALAYALLNFIGSLAAARYFNKTRSVYGSDAAGEEKVS